MLENEGVALKAIRWSEIFPWLNIGRSFRLAISLRLLVYGAAALLLTLVGWWAIANLFSHDKAPNASWSGVFAEETPWQVIDCGVADWACGPARQIVVMAPASDVGRVFAEAPRIGDTSGLNVHRWNPLFSAWYTFSRPVLQLVSQQPVSAADLLALILSSLWSLAIWAYFGAAISRVAAVELATGERVGWVASLRWARGKWLAYFAAPLVPMLGVTLAAAPIVVLGFLMKASFLAAVAGVIWPLVLAASFVMTLLLAGVLLGWPLMWATISVEGTDSFDALSRTYAYVFQKPLRYLIYIIIAAFVGWLGWIVVENFAAAVIWLGGWAAAWGIGKTPMSHTASALIAFWNGWVKLLALGYVFSYFAVASTAIYYQMRRDVDAREADEVFLDADQGEMSFGLPKLQKDAAGAPEVAANAAPAVQAASEATNDAEE
jgi:hypothetical protein